MKYKYTGDQPSVSIRGVTFEKGKAVDLTDNPALVEKVSVLEFFEQAKPRKAKANDKDKD